MNKNELSEIEADLLRVLDLPSKALDKLLDLLQSDGDINSFNVSEILGVESPKTDPLLSLLNNKNLDKNCLLVAIRAALATRKRALNEIEDFELCWTGPTSLEARERATDAVIAEMLDRAREKIIVVGYRITDKGKIMQKLSDCIGNVKEMIIIIDDDRMRVNKSTIEDAFRGLKKPRVFVHKKKEKAYYKVHAKVLIVDGKELLLTSANLTYYGLAQNFEMGVRLKGTPARNAESLVRKMIENKYFEEVS